MRDACTFKKLQFFKALQLLGGKKEMIRGDRGFNSEL